MIPIRLNPGNDLRAALDNLRAEQNWPGAFVLSGIGSLTVARLRLAGCSEATEWIGDLELLTLAGTLTSDGSHLHASIANTVGQVLGGHVLPGCIIRTTAEILIAPLTTPLHRKPDPNTGYLELTTDAA
ncbi:MAG: DNA-binding protein [Armatimonas sp.]